MKKIYNVIVKLSDEAKRDEFKNETAIFTDIKLHFADDKAGVKSLKKKIAADYAVLDCENTFGFAGDIIIGDDTLTAQELAQQLLEKCGLKEIGYNPETVDEFFHKVEMCIEAGREYTDDEIKQIINDVLKENGGMSRHTHNQIAGEVFNIIRGWDVLTRPLDNPNISEIMVNGTDRIFVEANGGISQLGIKFYSQQRLRNVINRMISQVGRQIDESNPIVDARLPDGSRINAVLDPVAINGPILTIRKFSREMLTMDDLIKSGSISKEAADFIQKLVEARYNIFISGSTSSGKTTMLNILSNFISSSERIVTIEDSAELQIQGIPNLVSLESRKGGTDGRGQISIRDLIKTSLRMRPDRIIVGEVRGDEANDMLQAMNTGHDGSLSTGHANGPEDMMLRLESLVLAAANMPINAIRRHIESAIDIVIHLSRLKDKSRRVTRICEVNGINEKGEVNLTDLFVLRDVDGELKLVNKGKLHNTFKLEQAGI